MLVVTKVASPGRTMRCQRCESQMIKSLKIAAPAADVEEPDAEPEAVQKERRNSIAEANSLWHLLTHFPKKSTLSYLQGDEGKVPETHAFRAWSQTWGRAFRRSYHS